MFCDNGADPTTALSSGLSPLIYAAKKGLDEICLYLFLRTKEIDYEDPITGYNVFMIYMLREDK